MLPKGHKLPDSFYASKKVVAPLGLGLQKIDACENDCMLFWKDDEDLQECKICHHPRFKPRKRGRKKKHKSIPFKQLSYLPLTPRLQRLYTSQTTAEHMRWHKKVPGEEGKLCHPRDGEAWKHFDRSHPIFAAESRNVRLALSADGFNPHNQGSRPYSCWPVIVTPYNLPPWMCMDRPYMFLTLLVPGPKSPGRSLDVYLQPLINELKTLWDVGVETYDVAKKQNFQMKAALMWTVSDFPAYGMLSGWSTHGKLACPYRMNEIKSFRLKHGGKPCFFDCHRQFLPLDHPYRYQKDNFTKGRIERDETVIRSTGDELEEEISLLPNIEFGRTKEKERIEGFGESHNWLKRSIFWDLPYWKTNLIRHNLDVMHIEKNVFDNVFNTVMDVKGKTKDNVKARLDLQNICNRRNLELNEVNGKHIKPKASYTLTKDERHTVLKWIKDLRLPDGYASNLGRCVNLDDYSMHGMKSHDCHVFIERLIPLAFRDLLPESVWNGLTELSQFFRALCSTVLSESDMKTLLNTLKRKVKNKARVEGSIVEAYLIEETSTFCSHFFAPDVETSEQAPLEEVYQEPSSSNLARVVLDHELDNIDILTDVHRQEEEVNPDELHPQGMELEQEDESDELEKGFVEPNDEQLVEEESGDEDDLTFSDNSPSHDDSGEEQDLPEEVHSQQDDLTHGSEPQNSNYKDEIERDEAGREILIIVGKCFVSTATPRSILPDLQGWYFGVWPTFSKIPDRVKNDLFDRFKGKFTWRDPWTEEQVNKIWKSYFSRRMTAHMSELRIKAQLRVAPPPRWMRQEIWEGLWNIWETPKFKSLQVRYRQNRLSDRNGLGTVKSTSGSISIPHHAIRMAKQNNGIPVPFQNTFARCHRTNQGKGPFVDEKSKNTYEKYTEKIKENQSQNDGTTMLPTIRGSCLVSPEAWAEASSGLKHEHCYGFGNSYSEGSTSSAPSSSTMRSQVQIENEKRFQELEKIQEEMDKKLEQRVKDGVKDGVMAVLNAIGMFPSHPGQFPTPSPGYFPPPATSFFHAPTPLAPSQYPVVGNYRAPSQNPPPHYQPPGRDHSPDQHHARD
ncbi:hypothetical protein BUALT_Bualt07G0056900 [Buddleja alternifolia]|uniref:DUF4218 domain-containing protein n=1 Tax=Buddleja alternifolia TaxID=168488 RepID=A0AAV6XF03_9LAMI|nr:hypothetical protein BUALT_Bualt07G0056900 [Buddleja alternifolia]